MNAVAQTKYAVCFCLILLMCEIMSLILKHYLDKAKIESIETCEVEGTLYRIGEQIYPSDSCYTCLCTEGFDNQTSYESNPNCSKINCGFELKINDLRNGCVPVYFRIPNCCYIEMKCRKFIFL